MKVSALSYFKGDKPVGRRGGIVREIHLETDSINWWYEDGDYVRIGLCGKEFALLNEDANVSFLR